MSRADATLLLELVRRQWKLCLHAGPNFAVQQRICHDHPNQRYPTNAHCVRYTAAAISLLLRRLAGSLLCLVSLAYVLYSLRTTIITFKCIVFKKTVIKEITAFPPPGA